MNKLRTLRGRGGVEVSLYTQNNNYYLTAKGRRPTPRVYRDSSGMVYDIERFSSPTTPGTLPLRANNRKDAEYQAAIVLKGIESATVAAPPPPMPEPETPEWVKELADGSLPRMSEPELPERFNEVFDPPPYRQPLLSESIGFLPGK